MSDKWNKWGHAPHKHTEGPWALEAGFCPPQFDTCFAISKGSGALASVWPNHSTPGEDEANARLIAAAPEMFEIIRELVECKQMKDVIDASVGGLTEERLKELRQEYERRKTAAWIAARVVVALIG